MVFSVGVSGSPTKITAPVAGENVPLISRTSLSLTVSPVYDRQLTSGSAVGNQSGANKMIQIIPLPEESSEPPPPPRLNIKG